MKMLQIMKGDHLMIEGMIEVGCKEGISSDIEMGDVKHQVHANFQLLEDVKRLELSNFQLLEDLKRL